MADIDPLTGLKKQGKGVPIPIEIKQDILLRFDDYRRKEMSIMAACTQISQDVQLLHNVDLSPKSVWACINRLRPTTDIAKLYLKAKAMKLVKRVVQKANVSEAIDLLSRPGMDVIGRPSKEQAGGPQGFFLTVQADTCGAVKVGVATGQPAQATIAESAEFDPFAGAIGGFDEDAEDRPAPKAVGRGESAHSALERARAKIAESRRNLTEGHSGHESL